MSTLTSTTLTQMSICKSGRTRTYSACSDGGSIAVKRLLRQTLSHDDALIEVHPLAELLMNEGLGGSTIKTDGEESDPWGLMGVIDVEKHRVNDILGALG